MESPSTVADLRHKQKKRSLMRKLSSVSKRLFVWASGEVDDHAADLDNQAETALATSESNAFALIKRPETTFAQLKSFLQEHFPGNSLIDIRGPVGESLLHAVYLFRNPNHKQLARQLIQACPALASSVYRGRMYLGESALHMAIANRDLDEVKFLLARCPRLLYGRARGEFFDRGSHFFANAVAAAGSGGGGGATLGSTNVNAAYLGELPLSFAVCTNQADLVRFLVVEKGAVISYGDKHGNTAAHMAVYHSRLEMLELLEALWDKGYGRPPQHEGLPLLAIRNGDGLTPLVLAAALGNARLFESLWRRQVFWKWGSVCSYLYPLEGIDTISELIDKSDSNDDVSNKRKVFSPDAAYIIPPELNPEEEDEEGAAERAAAAAAAGGANFNEASLFGLSHVFQRLPSHAALYGPFPTVLEAATMTGASSLLLFPPLATLLERKWARFGHAAFFRRLWTSVAYLIVLGTASISRSLLPATSPSCQAFLRDPFSSCPEGSRLTAGATSLLEALVITGAVLKLHWLWQRNDGLKRVLFPWCVGSRRRLREESSISNGSGSSAQRSPAAAGALMTTLPAWAVLCVLLGCVLDFFKGAQFGAALISLGALLGWTFFGSVAFLGSKTSGPFIVMLRTMLGTDLARFAGLASIVILAFSSSLFVLEPHVVGQSGGIGGGDVGFSGFFSRAKALLLSMLSQSMLEHGSDDNNDVTGSAGNSGLPEASTSAIATTGSNVVDSHHHHHHHHHASSSSSSWMPSLLPPSSAAALSHLFSSSPSALPRIDVVNSAALTLLGIAWALAACVLLVNILVASIGTTFSRIEQSAAETHGLELARLILSLERDSSPAQRLEASRHYWVTSGGRQYLTIEERVDSTFDNDETQQALRAALQEAKNSLPPKPQQQQQPAAPLAGAGAGGTGLVPAPVPAPAPTAAGIIVAAAAKQHRGGKTRGSSSASKKRKGE